MRILALDSSGLVASVAVVEKIEEEEQVIAEYTVNYKNALTDAAPDAGHSIRHDRA